MTVTGLRDGLRITGPEALVYEAWDGRRGNRFDALATARSLCRLPSDPRPVAPFLHALLHTDKRPVRYDDWRSARDDEALCAAARAVLDAD